MRAIVTHRPTGGGGGGGGVPMTGGRTCDRRGCLKKKDKYAPDAGQGFEKADSPPKAGQMATLVTSPAHLKTCTAL